MACVYVWGAGRFVWWRGEGLPGDRGGTWKSWVLGGQRNASFIPWVSVKLVGAAWGAQVSASLSLKAVQRGLACRDGDGAV